MSHLVEFLFSSVWGLKPYLVGEDIIPRLKKAGFDNAEILFDNRRNWFQITCQSQDEAKIKDLLNARLEEIQDNIDENDDDLVDEEGGLTKDLDNIWIDHWDENARMEAAFFTEFRLPEAFKDMPNHDVWELNHGRLSDIITKVQFREIEKQHSVVMGHNKSLTEVYIGAQSKEELDCVRAKLDVLVKIKELKHSEPTHLAWTESYKERDGFDMTFDTRFLANIDPALIAATFLDFSPSTGSAEDYELLVKAITVRLCRYDDNRHYHTSAIGPKLKARRGSAMTIGKRRYKQRQLNRPGAATNPYGAGLNPFRSVSPQHHTATTIESENSPYEGGEVEKWLNELEVAHAVTKSSGKGKSNDISPTVTDTKGKAKADDQNLIAFDLEDSVTFDTSGNVGSQDRSLLDMGDHFAVSLSPLKPQSRNGSALVIGKTRGIAAPLVDISVNGKENIIPGSSQAASSSKQNVPKDVAGSSYANAMSKVVPKPEIAAAQLPFWFLNEVNGAINLLVSTGPYLRGKVEVRADIGRILITGMDYSGLAYNAPGTPSNGWKKNHILHILNQGSRTPGGLGITFTKMLTQEGDDIEYMQYTTDRATGKPLWTGQIMEQVVYSFYCVSKGQSFFMDLTADEKASTFTYSLRTKQDDKAPIFIHCTLRSQDIRIVMSHVNTQRLEAMYGEFAKSFVDCFAVTVNNKNDKNVPQPHIQIGVHKGFGVSVESMRIHTKYRFLSHDEKSYLDITEVEETVFKAYDQVSETLAEVVEHPNGPSSPDQWMVYTVDPKRLPADIRASEELGAPTFWYEASIRSVEAEKVMEINKTMGLGEMAPWNFVSLAELGVVAAIVKPALRMAQVMDSVGAFNDNHQASKLVLPRENVEEVPGATYVTTLGHRFVPRHRTDSPATATATAASSRASSSTSSRRGRAVISHAEIQASGPPGTVVQRTYVSPPSTVPSPVPRAGALAPGQQTVPLGGNGRNIVNTMAPPVTVNSAARAADTAPAVGGGRGGGAGGGFGVTGPRDPSRTRQQPGKRQPSSTGSDASLRGPVPSYKPPSQFW